MDAMNLDAGLQLFRCRYARIAQNDSQLAVLFHPDSIPFLWEQTASHAKLLWRSEASGLVPFPSYELTPMQRDRVTTFDLWYDHHVMVLQEMSIPIEDFEQSAIELWEIENADTKRYWALKAFHFHRQIDERERHQLEQEEQLRGTGSVLLPLRLSEADRAHYFCTGRPYICSTCGKEYRNRRGLGDHLFKSESCDPNDESMILQLWECPGTKVGVCTWKTTVAKDMMRHLESTHGIYRSTRIL